MAITTDKRSPTEPRFETGDAFKGLCIYMMQICKNEKNFPKRDRWLLTQEIVKAAVKAYGHVMEANAIDVKTRSDYKLRRKHQVKAKAKLKKLTNYAEIAYEALNLGGERLETLYGYIDSCKNLLSSWRESDRKRYASIVRKPKKEKDVKAGAAEQAAKA